VAAPSRGQESLFDMQIGGRAHQDNAWIAAERRVQIRIDRTAGLLAGLLSAFCDRIVGRKIGDAELPEVAKMAFPN
jgi:hypothetical protein